MGQNGKQQQTSKTEQPTSENTPTEQPTAPATTITEAPKAAYVVGGRFARILGAIHFKSADGKSYPSTDGKRKSRKLANCLVELRGCEGVMLRAGVKAVLVTGKTKPFPEFTFFATQHQGSVVIEGEQEKREFGEWKDKIAIPDFLAWRKENNISGALPAGASTVELDDVEF